MVFSVPPETPHDELFEEKTADTNIELGSGLEVTETEGETGFKIFAIERNSTLPILDGAMRITCGDTSMSVKARICSHPDFGAVQASIADNNGVRLKQRMGKIIFEYKYIPFRV